MTDSTSLGDRMKAYEAPWKLTFPRRLPVVVRVDGRAFHSYLRGATKPFDLPFIADMAEVAKALCEEISGAVFAYHQSDEISVLVQDWSSEHTEPWFAGELQKIVSISAAVATYALAVRRSEGRAQMQELLFAEHAVNWNDYPVECRRGQVVVRKSGEREVAYVDKHTDEERTTTTLRSWWEAVPAPRFTAQGDGFLAEQIPPMPDFAPAAANDPSTVDAV